jgi:DNA-binding transcriptional LysR family regulator
MAFDVASLTWDDVRLLESLHRLGKVSAAARAERVSVSTFYRRLAELEQQTGQTCLVRGSTEASLTEFGLALAHVGKRMRGGLVEVFGEVRARETTLEGEVRLTTVHALLPFIEGALVKLNQQHPRLSVTLTLGDAGPSVRRREVDVALAVIKRPPAGCWGRKLGTLDAGVFGTSAALGRERRWVVRALDEAASPESAWEREHARGPLAARAPFHALVSLCAAGAGLAMMPALLARRHGLVEVPEYRASVAHLARPLWCLTHPALKRAPRVLALIGALSTAFADGSRM